MFDLKKPHILLATWFGSGLLKPAPGTWGSAASIPVGIVIYAIGGPLLLTIATLAIFIIGLYCVNKFQKETGTQDLSQIVIDETAGQWLVLIVSGPNLSMVLLAFLLFRFFDITKVFPAKWVENRYKNAWGVMGDDIIAGLYAAITLSLITLVMSGF